MSLPEISDHEVAVRWATSADLRARKAAEEKRQAPLKQQLRRQQVRERAEGERRDLEDAGQSGLF